VVSFSSSGDATRWLACKPLQNAISNTQKPIRFITFSLPSTSLCLFAWNSAVLGFLIIFLVLFLNLRVSLVEVLLKQTTMISI
jgi:hypothetical protein